MQLSGIPAKFNIPWANAANPLYIRNIPIQSQQGVTVGAASLTDGFPPVCFNAIGANGTPPWGVDYNGIFKAITQWNRWQAAGGHPVPYDASFQNSIGGYPQGAIVASLTTLGLFWLSVVDNNQSNPDAGGAGWQQPWPSTGELMVRATTETISGWVIGNGTTIGNASSGASQLADPSAQNLFVWHWNNFSNTQCPVSGVSGRGANALADFNAGKTITVLDYRGNTLVGVDTMQGGATTRLSGVPVTSGSTTAPGSVLGENLHQIISAEIPNLVPVLTGTAHSWNINQDPVTQNSGSGNTFTGTGFNLNTIQPTVTVTPAGSISSFYSTDNAHNTVSLSMGHTAYLHL